jgi:hypothetical protein
VDRGGEAVITPVARKHLLTNFLVTAVFDFDFFLQAHGGLQGTTRPTHYYVVWNEIKFNADQIQTLTHVSSPLPMPAFVLMATRHVGSELFVCSGYERCTCSLLSFHDIAIDSHSTGIALQPSVLRRHCLRAGAVLPPRVDAGHPAEWYDYRVLPE